MRDPLFVPSFARRTILACLPARSSPWFRDRRLRECLIPRDLLDIIDDVFFVEHTGVRRLRVLPNSLMGHDDDIVVRRRVLLDVFDQS